MAAVTDSALSTAGQVYHSYFKDKSMSSCYSLLCSSSVASFHLHAGNSYLTFYNTAALGPKGIAKRAAKDTGKAFIGVDVEAVAARASVVPDQQQLVRAQRIFKFKACQDGLGHFFFHICPFDS